MGVKSYRLAIILALAATAGAAELKPETVEAFQKYIRETETKVERRVKGGTFLWLDESPERLRRARAGEVVIEPQVEKGDTDVPHGLIHDWMGGVFIPGATLAGTIAAVQDYNHHSEFFKPEVIGSKLLSHNGNDFNVFLRVHKKKVLSVVLDTYHDARYFPLDATRCYSRSYSTRIVEIENPGKAGERPVPAGQDHGFLWRLYSYWRFMERDGGVYVECEAVSLTRNVPTGLGWLIEPIIRSLPRESLANTLNSTRNAARQRVPSR